MSPGLCCIFYATATAPDSHRLQLVCTSGEISARVWNRIFRFPVSRVRTPQTPDGPARVGVSVRALGNATGDRHFHAVLSASAITAGARLVPSVTITISLAMCCILHTLPNPTSTRQLRLWELYRSLDDLCCDSRRHQSVGPHALRILPILAQELITRESEPT